jgi:aminoglycoside 3-N-acetyltransferase
MKEKFITDIHNLGIKPGDTLLVHSSFKSLGLTGSSPLGVVEALMGAVPQGTLLLPALSYENVNGDNPRFSVKETPCCVGVIPETFRNCPGVVRSVHPTHSVCAYGKYAEEITKEHHRDRTPVGERSPFRKLAAYKGKIMMLGCGLGANTFLHGVEEAAGTPYVLTKDKTRFEIITAHGEWEEALHLTHDFTGIHQAYERVAGLPINITKGKVLGADVYVMEAVSLWDAAYKALKKDAYCLVVPQ